MLLLALLACDPIGAVTRESLTLDAAPTSAAPAPAAPTAPAPPDLHVYLFRRDGAGWRRDPLPFARAFSSLHAVAWEGELVVAGLPSARPPTWWEEWLPRLAVGALVTRDGTTWKARSYPVDAPGRSLVDPAIVEGPEGMELWFVQAEGLGDPAVGGRAVDLVRTRWDGARFGSAEVWATGRGLVDPAPVWFAEGWRVFATRDHGEVVVIDEKGGEARRILGGASVPFARVEGGAVVLLAQRMMGGRMMPVETRSTDLRTWSPPTSVLDDPDLRTCASPVVGSVAGADVLVCVDERR